MTLGPSLRKFVLTAHVASSVGWLGAVLAFLALGVVGMTSHDAHVVRSAYVAMNVVGAFVIVPLSVLALGTGVVQALGTHWGLIRHYWVVAKLALTILATTLLLLHQLTAVATAAQSVSVTAPDSLPGLDGLGTQLVFDAGAAVLLLVVTTVLSVYKPWGRTGYGRRFEASEGGPVALAAPWTRLPRGVGVVLAIAGVIGATILIIHLAGGGLRHH